MCLCQLPFTLLFWLAIGSRGNGVDNPAPMTIFPSHQPGPISHMQQNYLAQYVPNLSSNAVFEWYKDFSNGIIGKYHLIHESHIVLYSIVWCYIESGYVLLCYVGLYSVMHYIVLYCMVPISTASFYYIECKPHKHHWKFGDLAYGKICKWIFNHEFHRRLIQFI